MKHTVITALLTLGLGANVAMASENTDLSQIFSAQGKVATLSSQEMKTTEGAFSPLAAQVGFGSGTPGEPSADVLAFLQGLGIDTALVPEGGFTTEAEALAFLQSQGIDTTTFTTGTGFNSEADALAFLQGLGVDTANLPNSADFSVNAVRFGSF
jgi:hypothetical protein